MTTMSDERSGAAAPVSWRAFIHWTWQTTKEDHLGLLVGQGANLHAVQIAHSAGLAQPARESVVHRGHGSFTRKERHHAHHSLL
jgi:hypothetical protein